MNKGEIKCFKDELIKNSEVQARVTVIDDAIKEFMNANPNEGIKINLFNAKEELVLDRTAKPDELITYQSEQNGEFRLCMQVLD